MLCGQKAVAAAKSHDDLERVCILSESVWIMNVDRADDTVDLS